MKRIFILMAALLVGLTAVAQPKIVAHRGYWRTDGSAQNSITSLQKAAAVGCYGSEFDVWLTADGVPVVFHDATIDGIRIEDTTFATLMNHRLQNGEFIPTLQQYLTEGSKIEGCQLILEIKPHRNEVRDKRIADMCVELVRSLGLEKKTEYISFSKVVCQRLHEISPESKVAYLNGELAPAQIKEMGLTGIDYNEKVFVKHPEWLQEAKQLGVEVNVWTVDGEENLRHHVNLEGVDLITTNDPEILKGILAEQEAAKQPASKKSK
ncbi:MAG: glycerophosphodiester phosphodiesterase family protein [Bacteroidaceae bacterium]|nr:glycerophosphodiester phosphodiesterase family protein [Bacteroidaceae bacterium]